MFAVAHMHCNLVDVSPAHDAFFAAGEIIGVNFPKWLIVRDAFADLRQLLEALTVTWGTELQLLVENAFPRSESKKPSNSKALLARPGANFDFERHGLQ